MKTRSKTFSALCAVSIFLAGCADTTSPSDAPDQVAFAASASVPSTAAHSDDVEEDGLTVGENVAAAALVVGLVAVCPACLLAFAF